MYNDSLYRRFPFNKIEYYIYNIIFNFIELKMKKHIRDLKISESIGGEAVNGGVVWGRGGGATSSNLNNIILSDKICYDCILVQNNKSNNTIEHQMIF